jgi:hypothetical protein
MAALAVLALLVVMLPLHGRLAWRLQDMVPSSSPRLSRPIHSLLTCTTLDTQVLKEVLLK